MLDMNIIGLFAAFVIPLLLTWIPAYEIVFKIIMTVFLSVKFIIDIDVAKPGHSGKIYQLFSKLDYPKNEIAIHAAETIIRLTVVVISFCGQMWLPLSYATVICLICLINLLRDIKALAENKK